uniref:Uncharacterized protein n=1 Tax=Parascaris equorum TaxID=6256 RepID=A0A914R994_PAREQ
MPGLAATPNRESAVREPSFEHREEEIEQFKPHPAAEPIKLPDFNPAALNRQPQIASDVMTVLNATGANPVEEMLKRVSTSEDDEEQDWSEEPQNISQHVAQVGGVL